MIHKFYIFLVLYLTGVGLANSEDFVESETSYLLGSGDVIQISVYGESDLSLELKISDDMELNYAYIGSFKFHGKSVSEVVKLVTNRLEGDYLIDPQVSVRISEYRPFFIQGQVNHPGSFAYQPGLTIRKAISLAGGLGERASSRKWYVIAEDSTEDNKQKISEDSFVYPGDTIIIEESFF